MRQFYFVILESTLIYTPFALIKIEKKFLMNASKMKALNGSIKISGEEEKERQAYILENKPKLVEEELKKYCL